MSKALDESKEDVLPRISVVTPSFNQAEYLETTIRSVLDQNYPNIEYIVIDGGSTDGSVDIIEQYAERCTYWVSEPDRGHGHAINKGFAHSSGEIMCWLNSDDVLLPGSLLSIGTIFADFADVEWLTSSGTLLDPRGRIVRAFRQLPWTRGLFLNAPADNHIQQESTVWRRSLWDRAGGSVSEEYLACDFELWARFFRHARLYQTPGLIGGFRMQPEQRSVLQKGRYRSDVQAVLERERTDDEVSLPDEIAESYAEIVFNPATWSFEKKEDTYFVAPAVQKFFRVDAELSSSVFVDCVALPWELETTDNARALFHQHTVRDGRSIPLAWLGSGAEGALVIGLRSRYRRNVRIRFLVAPGPAREDPRRTLQLVRLGDDSATVVASQHIDEAASVYFSVDLTGGRNRFQLAVAEQANVQALPNGEDRPLLAAISEFNITPD